MSHCDYNEDVVVQDVGWLLAWWMRQHADEPEARGNESSQAESNSSIVAPSSTQDTVEGTSLNEKVDGADVGSGPAGRVGGIAPC